MKIKDFYRLKKDIDDGERFGTLTKIEAATMREKLDAQIRAMMRKTDILPKPITEEECKTKFQKTE